MAGRSKADQEELAKRQAILVLGGSCVGGESFNCGNLQADDASKRHFRNGQIV
jgi:hypothetical protein